MTGPLDSRVIRILRWLLAQDRVRSTASLAADLGLSQRVVRYRLGSVENYLADWGLVLERRRGAGLRVETDAETRAAVIADLESQAEVPRVYSPQERSRLLLAALIWEAPSMTSLEDIHLEIEVSKASARRDLQAVEPWLERNGLPLVRKPGKGLMVVGSERRIRQIMVQLILETVPEEVLLAQLYGPDPQHLAARVPVGLRERLLELPLRPAAAAIPARPLQDRLFSGRGDAVFALYLAVTVARLQLGHRVEVEAGLQRSVMDHPITECVEGLIPQVESLAGAPLEEAETAAIVEYLLGLDALEAVEESEDATSSEVADRALALAGERLHPALADDPELRRSLSAHLERLTVRLRHGLPIHNPLLGDVMDRYPDVHAVARSIADDVGDSFSSPIVDDEVGFLTMYLSGAMERARLKPRLRALVVCPSGMATVWVLTSRIQAEFPELDLVAVLSEQSYEQLDHRDFDLVISTVPVVDHGAPVVVVSALLPASDVTRLGALV